MRIRNIFCFLILIFCGFIAGCDKEKIEKEIDTVNYLNIKFELEENLYVGDTYNLFDYLEITTNITEPNIEFASEDGTMIEFAGNAFLCVKAGTTNIYVRGEIGDGKYVYAREKIVVENRPTYYTSFLLNKSQVFVDYGNRENVTNTAIFTGESTYPVVVEYSNNLVQYDYKTGKIDVYGVGECKVTLKVPASRDENKVVIYDTYSFDVIIDKYITNCTLKGSAGGINLKVGETGEFLIDISPKSYTVNPPLLEVNSDILTLEGYRFTANASGECLITMSYETGIGVSYSKEYRVKIYDVPQSINLSIYDGASLVVGDLEIDKEYTLLVSADCDLGNFTNIHVNMVAPSTLEYILLTEASIKDGVVKYKFTVSKACELNIVVGYYKDTYSSQLTCTDSNITKNVVSS